MKLLLALLITLVVSAVNISAQTSAFTYQGKLADAGAPANGNYDLQFALFDNLAGGAQVGATQTVNTVAVSAGIFTVSLDFGANATTPDTATTATNATNATTAVNLSGALAGDVTGTQGATSVARQKKRATR